MPRYILRAADRRGAEATGVGGDYWEAVLSRVGRQFAASDKKHDHGRDRKAE